MGFLDSVEHFYVEFGASRQIG